MFKELIVGHPDTLLGIVQSVLLLIGCILASGILLALLASLFLSIGSKTFGTINNRIKKLVKNWLDI